MRMLAACAVVAGLAGVLAGCSSAVENPFPSVRDTPAPRAETTMTPEQVKQATDALEAERIRLGGAPATAAAAQSPPVTVAAQRAPATTGSTKTAGATTKP